MWKQWRAIFGAPGYPFVNQTSARRNSRRSAKFSAKVLCRTEPRLRNLEAAFALFGRHSRTRCRSIRGRRQRSCYAQYVREKFGPGEVILPSFTFVASANTVVAAGLQPRFAEVNWATYEVTAEHIEPLITDRTRAIMVVHFAGRPCAMPADYGTSAVAWALRSSRTARSVSAPPWPAGKPAASESARFRSTAPRTLRPVKEA